MAAAEASAGSHAHIANQHVAQLQIVRLHGQALDKQNQVRMTEIAALILTHDLIIR